MTIKQAALDVMRRYDRPMSSREVYDVIIEAGIYNFNSPAAAHIVQTQIRRHCSGVTTKDSSPNKSFSLVGRDLYLPLKSSKTDITQQSAIEIDLLRIFQSDYSVRSEFAGEITEENSLLSFRSSIGTTTKRLIDARLGQGKFRSDLEKIWNGRCAVTGCTTKAALRASHIKAWAVSTNEERLDGNNGLLLIANLDALFDQFRISFSDTGEMLISKHLPKQELFILCTHGRLRKSPNERQRKYLDEHRVKFFLQESEMAHR